MKPPQCEQMKRTKLSSLGGASLMHTRVAQRTAHKKIKFETVTTRIENVELQEDPEVIRETKGFYQAAGDENSCDGDEHDRNIGSDEDVREEYVEVKERNPAYDDANTGEQDKGHLDVEDQESVDTSAKVVGPITASRLEAFQKRRERTGVVYLSRIPPFMKPAKIRHLLSKFGEVGRVYLAPEDPKLRRRRTRYGGNKKQNYTEGWVEFADKRMAKMVASTLNAKPIGGKKGGFYHDDLWNIKYLPKFKWTNLSEQIAYEKAVHLQRLRTEISQTRRENKDYVHKVERSKMIRSIEERRKRKRNMDGGTTEEQAENEKRGFKQRRPVTQGLGPNVVRSAQPNEDKPSSSSICASSGMDPEVSKVLAKVFGK